MPSDHFHQLGLAPGRHQLAGVSPREVRGVFQVGRRDVRIARVFDAAGDAGRRPAPCALRHRSILDVCSATAAFGGLPQAIALVWR